MWHALATSEGGRSPCKIMGTLPPLENFGAHLRRGRQILAPLILRME